MSTAEKLTPDDINKLADNIRVIDEFTKNNNFDLSLLKTSNTTEPTPHPKKANDTKSIDVTLGVVIFAIVIFLACVMSKVLYGIQGTDSTILLLLTILFIGISCGATQIRFQNYVATIILAISLMAITAIGFEIYTAKEVIEAVEAKI